MSAAPPAPLIRLERVGRSFDGGRIVALRAVDFALGRHDLVGVHGPSGSGKSTLFNMMSGLDRPTEGSVGFDGQAMPSPVEWSALRRRRLGLVFQDFCLLPTLTVVENVEVAMFGLVRGAAERRRRALAGLEQMGLGPCADRLPQELAGGERRRAGLARALINRPDVLLADEPTANLDSATGAMVCELLLALHARCGMAMVVISHDPALIGRCPRRIHMLDGIAREEAT